MTPGPNYSRENPEARDEGADARDQQAQGFNPRPTNAPLKTQTATPAEYNTSGIERALGAHADRVHRVRK